jgi:hypothetical protein
MWNIGYHGKDVKEYQQLPEPSAVQGMVQRCISRPKRRHTVESDNEQRVVPPQS